MFSSDYKSTRMLALYSELMKGKLLRRAELADRFHVSERSIQRDMEALRAFCAEQESGQDIVYDRKEQGYRMFSRSVSGLTNSEILAVSKILLESRSMVKEELLPLLDKLVDCCVPVESRRTVQELLANEKFLYVAPHHGKALLPGLWELGEAVRNHRVLELEYSKLKGPETVARVVEPVGLMFSEYYFYLVAYIRDGKERKSFDEVGDLYPAIYRVDRIQSFRETGEVFHPVYAERFQEGEFRKRVQFMYGGKLRTVTFTYSGPSIEAVLDRLPTAEVIKEENGSYTVRAEVFGSGIEMWLRSQGSYVSDVSM